MVFSLFLIIDSIITLDEAVTNKTHELQRTKRNTFCTLDKLYKSKTKRNKLNETSLHNMSPFANLNFSHLISFEALSPTLVVTLL